MRCDFWALNKMCFLTLPKLPVAGDLSANCSTHAVLRQQSFCRREWYVCVEQRVFARKMSGVSVGHEGVSCRNG